MKRVSAFLRWMGLLLFSAGLVAFPKEASAGALGGLVLCFRQVIPALFPYFVLSSLAVQLGGADILSRPFGRVMRFLFHLPETCAPALVLGLLGGYPVGAKTGAALYESGKCSKEELSRLLTFCNNAGPGFLLGFVGSGIFHSTGVGVLLWAIHAASALLAGILLRGKARADPGTPFTPPGNAVSFSDAFSSALSGAVQSSLGICGAVMFFSVLPALSDAAGFAAFLRETPLLHALAAGFLELTSGAAKLPGTLSPAVAAAVSALLGWGGLCVHLQTVTVLRGTGVSLKRYFCAKALHALVSAVTAYAVFSLPGLLTAPAFSAGQTDVSFPFSALSFLVAAILFFCCLFLRKKGGKSHRHGL